MNEFNDDTDDLTGAGVIIAMAFVSLGFFLWLLAHLIFR